MKNLVVFSLTALISFRTYTMLSKKSAAGVNVSVLINSNNNTWYKPVNSRLLKLGANNFELYPNFTVPVALKDLIKRYGSNFTKICDQNMVKVAGRVMKVVVKDNGTSYHYNLLDDGIMIELVATNTEYETEIDFKIDTEKIVRGDIIGTKVILTKDENNKLIFKVKKLILLAPCLHSIPTSSKDLKKQDFRPRFLDLILNANSRRIFTIRTKMIKFIRKFLDDRDFLEVETPILHDIPGGATAPSFKLYSDVLKKEFVLRIAPEYYLKALVIGGLNRVYEIGRQFRNEPGDPDHNPEFTSLEFYQAYSDHNDMLSLTETIISELVKYIKGSYKFEFIDSDGTEHAIDCTPPFKKVDFKKALEQKFNISLPDDLESKSVQKLLYDLVLQRKLRCSSQNLSELFGCICSKLQLDFKNPTFLVNYPQALSTFAKYDKNSKGFSEHFELFAMGYEIANAYTELNDPVFQRKMFENIDEYYDGVKNEDYIPIDENFCKALEYGLPPTGGCGIGIDRLVMLLTSSNVNEVILFPT